MIIGTTQIDYNEVKLFVSEPTSLITYVENLVPCWARCIPHIVDNQRYYVAIHIRNVLSIPYKTRMAAANALIEDIRVSGIMTAFTPITAVIDSCDKDALLCILRGKNYEKD